MLKRFLFVATLCALAAPAFPQANPRGEAKASVAGKAVSIEYGRPSLKGRDMLAQAQVGKAWRLGADAATTLTTEADLAFGGVEVPKGTYILTATKVDADTWHLNVLNKADRAKVADIPLTAGKTDEPVEAFTIKIKAEGDKGKLHVLWGETALAAAVTGTESGSDVRAGAPGPPGLGGPRRLSRSSPAGRRRTARPTRGRCRRTPPAGRPEDRGDPGRNPSPPRGPR